MSETLLLQYLFGVFRALCVRACVLAFVHPSGLVRAITSTFTNGFQNNLAPLFSLISRSAI